MHTWVCEQRRGGHPVWAVHEQWELPDKPQMPEYQAEGQMTREPHMTKKTNTGLCVQNLGDSGECHQEKMWSS